MKFALNLIFCIIVTSATSQVTILQPRYHYVSEWRLEEIQELPVGEKILFSQNCTSKLPKDVPTGVVFFENVIHNREKFSIAVEFKDTVVTTVTYFLKGNQGAVLGAIGYNDIKVRGSASGRQWTYRIDDLNRNTTIVGDKRKIVVIQSLAR